MELDKLIKKECIKFAKWIDRHYWQGDDFNKYYICKTEMYDGKLLTITELYNIYENDTSGRVR